MRLCAVLLATVLVAGPVLAQTQSPPAPSPAKSVKGDPNRMVCKTLPTTGSRLKPNKDCRTAQQWSDDQAIGRRDIDRLQSNRYNGNSGT